MKRIKSYNTESILDILKSFVSNVASGLSIETPVVMMGRLNRAYEKPLFRGLYHDSKNAIILASDFGFRDDFDLELSARHEVAEWLEYVITGERVYRISGSPHSEDMLHKALMGVIKHSYPNDPQKVVDWVSKRLNNEKNKIF